MLAYLIRRVCRRVVTGLWEPFLDSGTPPLTRKRKGQPVRLGTGAGWSSSTRALNWAAESPAHVLALILGAVLEGAGPGLHLSRLNRELTGSLRSASRSTGNGFQLKALPPGWMLPQGRRQIGPSGDAGPAPGEVSVEEAGRRSAGHGPACQVAWGAGGQSSRRPD